jgi:hypothetical protein
MRAHTSFYSLLTAAALSATAAAPASAQQAAASGYARLAANAAAVANHRPGTRTLATYDFDSSLPGMPSRVTVADSAGTLVASFRPRGTAIEQPMKVAIADRDILLEGETARGTLAIALYDQNDPKTAGTILGTWSLGSLQGELRARAVR